MDTQLPASPGLFSLRWRLAFIGTVYVICGVAIATHPDWRRRGVEPPLVLQLVAQNDRGDSELFQYKPKFDPFAPVVGKSSHFHYLSLYEALWSQRHPKLQ